jgi:hypothetical protein
MTFAQKESTVKLSSRRMKSAVNYGVWILLMAFAAACGGGNQPGGAQTPQSGPQSQSPATGGGGSDSEKKMRMIMGKNDDHDGKITSACMALVTIPRLKAQRGHKVTWIVEDDGDNSCSGLDAADIEVRFNDAILVDPMNPSALTASVKGKNGRVDAKIAKNATAVPNKRYPYTVFYLTQQASDPELDISGDCGSCGPQ